ncbi:hypothetical protein CLOM_g5711 [Closterium sp. NIES-68]|nr:hypothetical protein CLOM_g5711 [Closterium sp. NIES-68]
MSASGTSTPGWVGSGCERVVVGVNKDPCSKDAIRWAIANRLKHPDDMLILLHVVTKVPTHQKVEMYQSDVNNTTFVHYVRTVVQPMMLELKSMVDNKIKLELKVGRNNSKERGIVDESRKLKATTLVVGTSSRGIFGIRGRGGVGGYCMKNRPPTVSVYVILKDRVTACREVDASSLSPPASSSSAPTSPGRERPALASYQLSPSPSAHQSPSASVLASAQHLSDCSSTHHSSGALEPNDSLAFDDAGSFRSVDDEGAATANGAQPPGTHSQTAPQPCRAGTWPTDQAASPIPGGSPGFQARSPGTSVHAYTVQGTSLPRFPGEGDMECIMQLQQLQLQNQQQMQHLLQVQQQQQHQLQVQQLQQRLQRDYLAEVDAWRRANTHATAEQQQAFMADLEARMAHARAALAGLPLTDSTRRAQQVAQQVAGEADDSPRAAAAAAAQAGERETEMAARIGQMALEAERARAAAVEARRAAEAEGGEAVMPVVRRVHHYREYTFEEIQAATDNFSADRKLGEGGFGTVYSGTLHHTPVAVKLLKSKDSIQAMAEFQQEVEILSQIQHPHVLMLLGCCPDRYVLVYEYLANGSLEDRLLCLNNSPPLPWFVRIRVAAEIASSLLILHTRSVPIVHRDLKPGNILLDKNFVAKLGDVGLAKLMPGLSMERTCEKESVPVGTFAYVDPEFQRTGEFGPKSDVYAFGIVLLDLLTGRTPTLYEALEVAVENNRNEELMRFLDSRAGTWPAGMPMAIAKLAIHCSEMKRRKRPDLETEVMPILDRMRSVAVKAEDDAKKASLVRPVAAAPPCLFCPITQELMVNPVIAADGHTYELVAIQQWLEKSDRSPMTNVRLPSKALVPNRALRSMILDWQEDNGSK